MNLTVDDVKHSITSKFPQPKVKGENVLIARCNAMYAVAEIMALLEMSCSTHSTYRFAVNNKKFLKDNLPYHVSRLETIKKYFDLLAEEGRLYKINKESAYYLPTWIRNTNPLSVLALELSHQEEIATCILNRDIMRYELIEDEIVVYQREHSQLAYEAFHKVVKRRYGINQNFPMIPQLKGLLHIQVINPMMFSLIFDTEENATATEKAMTNTYSTKEFK